MSWKPWLHVVRIAGSSVFHISDAVAAAGISRASVQEALQLDAAGVVLARASTLVHSGVALLVVMQAHLLGLGDTLRQPRSTHSGQLQDDLLQSSVCALLLEGPAGKPPNEMS